MADRGITFSAAMVRALLGGRKTQTRRLLNLRGYRQFSDFGPSDTPGYDWHFRRSDACWCDFRAEDLPLPHAPEDRLYVREHWKAAECFDHIAPRDMAGGEQLYYLADNSTPGWPDQMPITLGRHRQAMHMPRWASRLTLLVTDVRVQRLQDISEADAIAEGIYQPGGVSFGWTHDASEPDWWIDPVFAYRKLWDSLHTDPGTRWADNPWIYPVSFDVVRGNIDNLEGVN